MKGVSHGSPARRDWKATEWERARDQLAAHLFFEVLTVRFVRLQTVNQYRFFRSCRCERVSIDRLGVEHRLQDDVERELNLADSDDLRRVERG